MAFLAPRLRTYGITRVAEQTNLDTIGIPCFAAFRPNSRTLAVNQGKGIDDDAARVSATMEAIEFAVAEEPTAARTTATTEDLLSAGTDHYVPSRSLPFGFRLSPVKELTWLTGTDIATGAQVLVPLDAVALAPNAPERLPFSQSSNGLGAGFSFSEAAAHAFCELLERDASALWSFLTPAKCLSTQMDAAGIDDTQVKESVARLVGAGFDVRLYDLTTDLEVPVVMALVWRDVPSLFFDVASGVCGHPVASKAALGAILEAAQTRISNISGSRDDIDPSEYQRRLPGWLVDLTHAPSRPTRGLPRSLARDEFDQSPKLIGGRTIAVPLGSNEVSVVKILSEAMEDRTTNVHWRPGVRAIKAMTRI